mmetsp:Transcript_20046/g.36224  ORF Transcript_20046/g.36224 Transcript_20046/m.36224 type:complete len:110 (-) Transcript_20046:42-371(-)
MADRSDEEEDDDADDDSCILVALLMVVIFVVVVVAAILEDLAIDDVEVDNGLTNANDPRHRAMLPSIMMASKSSTKILVRRRLDDADVFALLWKELMELSLQWVSALVG